MTKNEKTMPRLIDADALDKRLQDINDNLKKLRENIRFEFMWDDIASQITTIHEIRRQIMTIPTIDAEPVRHGWWKSIFDDDQYEGSFACSVCKEENFFAFDESRYRYCPHCGAKMDGGAEDAK